MRIFTSSFCICGENYVISLEEPEVFLSARLMTTVDFQKIKHSMPSRVLVQNLKC